MQVAGIQENFDIAPQQAVRPALPAGGAILRVIGCGLCGSDLDKLLSRKAPPGSVLGHEVVGEILSLDPACPPGWQVGDILTTAHHVPCGVCRYCLGDSESMCRQFKRTNLDPGGFSEYLALTEGHLRHTAVKVPNGIAPEDAACMEPLACVIRAARRGGVRSDLSVLIVGLGFIGLLASQVYRNAGCVVHGVEPREERRTLAMAHDWMTEAFHPEDPRLAEMKEAADVVFLTVVNPATVSLALQSVRDGGVIILFAAGAPNTVIDPTPLYFREINLITSYSPSLRDLREAAEMIFSRAVHVKPLVTHTFPLSDISRAFALYRSGEAIKAFITMASGESREDEA